jgi:glycosyltransferase involved in cell wall biosynthesis
MPVKRFEELIRVMAEVRRTHPDVELTIVGDGAEREHLEELIADLDASDWVSMPGRLSDDALVDLYQRAWVLASASAAEGWGMTVTEAAACGTPAVVTDIAGHRDAVQSGITGVLSPDMAALARDIGGLLGDRARREQMSAAGRARAAALTWEATATGTLAALAAEATRLRPPGRRS